MAAAITLRTVKGLRPPAKGNKVVWDDQVTGFGARITAAGAVSFVLRYVVRERERRYTIGRWPDWSVTAARDEAVKLRGEIAKGLDPLTGREREREAPTLADVAERFLASREKAGRKPSSIAEYRRLLDRQILPQLGRHKIDAVTRADVAKLKTAIEDTPYQANRVLAVLSALYGYAVRSGLVPDGTNPARHVEKYKERSRERFLSPAEIARLGETLAAIESEGAVHPSAVLAIRLLVLTGARRSEIVNARWEWVDWERGVLRLPDSKTGAKIVPLGAPALAVLDAARKAQEEAARKAQERAAGAARGKVRGRRRSAQGPAEDAVEVSPYVCPGRDPDGPFSALPRAWQRIRKRAGLDGVRIHDLRHSFASTAVASGMSLPMIGAMLGHRDQATTQRYAHLADDPVRAAADRTSQAIAAALVSGRTAGQGPDRGNVAELAGASSRPKGG